MLDDDDEDDGLLFDETDEDEASAERTNLLVIPARVPTPEMLSALEQQYRREGAIPCQFIEDGDDGQPFFGNALEYAKLMQLPADVLPTMDEADQWVASRTWPSWEW